VGGGGGAVSPLHLKRVRLGKTIRVHLNPQIATTVHNIEGCVEVMLESFPLLEF
jgi:hypothetical protein